VQLSSSIFAGFVYVFVLKINLHLSDLQLNISKMPDRDGEVFSNPLPPSMHDAGHNAEEEARPLKNADFRKLMMTPRAPAKTPSAKEEFKAPATPAGDEKDDPATLRKKKKSYYANLKKQEEEREKELADKYRDRAQERRQGSGDYQDPDIVSTTADYRAVAPDARAEENQAERRKQVIQESKYLGGDMEHTHLVKGLDYALLEKVRAEISAMEHQQEEQMEAIATTQETNTEKKEEDPEVQMQFNTRLARNVFRTVFKNQLPERNELFLPRRMAYVVDLEDEYVESDIPTTLIRSKADCPTLEATTTLTTNDIVINKLTQILSYLRQGRREAKKLKKKEKGRIKEGGDGEKNHPKMADDSIYGEIGDYNPAVEKGKEKERKDRDRRERDGGRDRGRDRERGRDRDRDRDRGDRDRGDKSKKSYFEKPTDEDDDVNRPESAKELVKSINAKFAKGWAPADLEREATLQPNASDKSKAAAGGPEERVEKKIKQKMSIDSYAECYPGMMESVDAFEDSDDEVDYSKMDQGNKKGPIGRWDFDTQEEYSDFMANKEALPKAAFQYGVKMADGRKTRRTGPKDEKRELDREWQKIQSLMNKRKTPGGNDEPSAKNVKY